MCPKVSVIVMVYNSAQYLTACLDSLCRQTMSDFEVLLVDDASTDESPLICRRYTESDHRFRLIRFEQNKGLSFSRAKSLLEAHGEYVAILDSDDITHERRLEKQADWLDSHPETVLVAGYYEIIDCNERRLRKIFRSPLTDEEVRLRIAFGNCLGHSTVMFRKDPALACGGYNSQMKAGEDMEFYSRIMTLGSAAVIPEVLAYYRIHDINKHLVEPTEHRELYRSNVQQSVLRHLKQKVSIEVASALVDSYLESAANIDVFKKAVRLVMDSPWLLRDFKGEPVMVSSILKRCALLALMKLRRRNIKQPWWNQAEPGWKHAVRKLSYKGRKYFWFADSGLFWPKRLIAARELFPLLAALFGKY